MHMVCTTRALIYYQSFTNGVHPMCTSSALCVTLSSVSTVTYRKVVILIGSYREVDWLGGSTRKEE